VGYLWLVARPQNPLNLEESEVNPQEHLPTATTEITQIEAVSEGLLDENHQAKWHEFTFDVGMSFISYPLVLTPLI
jgi:hypothetical protein